MEYPGVVLRVLRYKGFGFISSAKLDDEVFFHRKDMARVTFEELLEGDRVAFEYSMTPQGAKAVNVRRV